MPPQGLDHQQWQQSKNIVSEALLARKMSLAAVAIFVDSTRRQESPVADPGPAQSLKAMYLGSLLHPGIVADLDLDTHSSSQE